MRGKCRPLWKINNSVRCSWCATNKRGCSFDLGIRVWPKVVPSAEGIKTRAEDAAKRGRLRERSRRLPQFWWWRIAMQRRRNNQRGGVRGGSRPSLSQSSRLRNQGLRPQRKLSRGPRDLLPLLPQILGLIAFKSGAFRRHRSGLKSIRFRLRQ
jgi:hypothetical protein